MRNLCRFLLVPKIGFRFTEEPKIRVMQLCMVQAERFELTSTALSVLPLTTWVHLHVATRMGVEPMSPERQSGIITVIPTSRIGGRGWNRTNVLGFSVRCANHVRHPPILVSEVGLEPTVAKSTGFTVRGDTNYTLLAHM